MDWYHKVNPTTLGGFFSSLDHKEQMDLPVIDIRHSHVKRVYLSFAGTFGFDHKKQSFTTRMSWDMGTLRHVNSCIELSLSISHDFLKLFLHCLCVGAALSHIYTRVAIQSSCCYTVELGNSEDGKVAVVDGYSTS